MSYPTMHRWIPLTCGESGKGWLTYAFPWAPWEQLCSAQKIWDHCTNCCVSCDWNCNHLLFPHQTKLSLFLLSSFLFFTSFTVVFFNLWHHVFFSSVYFGLVSFLAHYQICTCKTLGRGKMHRKLKMKRVAPLSPVFFQISPVPKT